MATDGASRRILGAAVLMAVGILMLGRTASAAPDPAVRTTQLAGVAEFTLNAGLDGILRPGGSVLVSATVSADDALDARVRISRGPEPAYLTLLSTIEIEIGAGTTKQIDVALAAPSASNTTVVAELSVEGRPGVLRREVPLVVDPGGEHVGLLPSRHAILEPLLTTGGARDPSAGTGADPSEGPGEVLRVHMPSTSSDALVTRLEPNRWRTPPWEAFGTLVGTAADIGPLEAGQRTALVNWLIHGGRLVVDDPVGTVLASLPAEWATAPSTDVGLGEISFTDGAVLDGNLPELLVPTPSITSADPLQLGGFISEETSMAEELPYDAELPDVPVVVMGIGLAAYALIVGPLLFFVLGRTRRRGLAWVAVPILALVVSGGSLVSAEGSGAHGAHMSLLETSPGGATVTTFLGAPASGRLETDLPTGWGQARNPATDASSWMCCPQSGALPSQDELIDDHGAVLRASPEEGSFASLSAAGPVSTEDAVVVEVTGIEGRRIEGTITNATAFDLTEVIVFTGANFAELDDLAPGASVPFVLRATEAAQGIGSDWFHWEPESDDVVVEDRGFVVLDGGADVRSFDSQLRRIHPPDADVAVRSSLWSWVRGQDLEMTASVAVVGAVGWTRDYTPPLSPDAAIDGLGGRTAVTGYSSGNRLRDGLGWRVVRSTWGGPIFEFRLPHDLSATELANLVIKVPQGRTVGLFDGVEWSWIEPGELEAVDPATGAPVSGDFAGDAVRVPAGAIVNGRVLATMAMDSAGDMPRVRMAVLGS